MADHPEQPLEWVLLQMVGVEVLGGTPPKQENVYLPPSAFYGLLCMLGM